MNNLSLKDQIEIKRNPEGYLFRKLAELEQTTSDKITEMTGKYQSEIEKVIQDSKTQIDTLIKTIPELKDGDTPTDEQLIALIKPLIPEVSDGKTPSDAHLLELIKSLMPENENETIPSDEELLALIKPLIPEKITNAELLVMIEALMPDIEQQEDTGDEIAVKLNTTQNSVNMEVIRGLKEWMKNIQLSIRQSQKGGGGGMGNAVPQSFNVSSATTSITLSDRVAAMGKALWLYYEGAWLVPGTAFTIRADRKTVDLLFTPEDGTHVDGLLIRG